MIPSCRVILVFLQIYSNVGEGFSRLCCIDTLWGIFFTVTSYLPTVYRNVLSFVQLFINVSVLQELMTCFGICSYTECKY